MSTTDYVPRLLDDYAQAVGTLVSSEIVKGSLMISFEMFTTEVPGELAGVSAVADKLKGLVGHRVEVNRIDDKVTVGIVK